MPDGNAVRSFPALDRTHLRPAAVNTSKPWCETATLGLRARASFTISAEPSNADTS